jgi:hypothetical protein
VLYESSLESQFAMLFDTNKKVLGTLTQSNKKIYFNSFFQATVMPGPAV